MSHKNSRIIEKNLEKLAYYLLHFAYYTLKSRGGWKSKNGDEVEKFDHIVRVDLIVSAPGLAGLCRDFCQAA